MNYGSRKQHGVAQARKSSWASAIEGQRFGLRSGAYSVAPVGVLSPISFVATTPLLIIQNSASSKALVLSSLWFTAISPLAGGPIYVSIFRDTAARRSSGGTQLLTYSVDGVTHAAGAGIAGFTAWSLPTASAAVNPATTAGVGSHPLYDFSFNEAIDRDPIDLDIEDGIRIGTTGSILVYMWAATTGATVVIGGEVIEELGA